MDKQEVESGKGLERDPYTWAWTHFMIWSLKRGKIRRLSAFFKAHNKQTGGILFSKVETPKESL